MIKLAKAELAPKGKMHRVWTPRRSQAKCLATFLIVFGFVLVYGLFYPFAAHAQCQTSRDTITCSGAHEQRDG